MPDVIVTSAQSHSAGTFKTELGQTFEDVPAFCRVIGYATPTPKSRIGFEVWLPLQGWNGRYTQVGNGGLAGVIFHQLLVQMVQRGYATASTDNGHQASPIDGRWAIGAPEKVRDFADRAIHVTSGIGKAVTAKYYETAAKRSYFFGCSEGGREAMIEAQRDPEAFDGIVAGAPAADWTGLMAGFVASAQALHQDPKTFIPVDKLPMIQAAALEACDASDGVKDGLVSSPGSCRFDPKVLACTTSAGGDCLTPPQVEALTRLYAGLRDARSGEVIAPGYVPSGENETGPIGGGLRQYAFGAAPGQSLHAAFATGYFGGFVFEKADWDFRKFDFDKDLAFARKKLGAMMDATNPDLSAFQKRGGKLIHYHGLLDGSIPPAMSTRHYDKVVAKVGTRTATLDFYRLFLAPGVLHCGYGPGPNSFGNIGPRGPADADHDTLLALERWVEQGVAPAKIIATKYVDDEARKGVQMTRPLCAYPQVARWMGKGQATDAMSFSCVDEK
jgi:feruloyl esterase